MFFNRGNAASRQGGTDHLQPGLPFTAGRQGSHGGMLKPAIPAVAFGVRVDFHMATRLNFPGTGPKITGPTYFGGQGKGGHDHSRLTRGLAQRDLLNKVYPFAFSLVGLPEIARAAGLRQIRAPGRWRQPGREKLSLTPS